ncbi:hypothetical protein [Streptomyces sp. NPDC001820]|uniref:hypothetical protein n=1 Tax=Streptomyces sp. NPDC001820 TaxID=3364613 RepID=UPI0036BA0A0A
MHAAQAYCGGFLAELGDGGGEALGVQAGGIAQGAVLIDPLAPVGHDQGDQARSEAVGEAALWGLAS